MARLFDPRSGHHKPVSGPMIVLDLRCDEQHRFEGWFASADEFEQQRATGMVACPVCGSTRIERLLSAPYVQTSHKPTGTTTAVDAATLARQLAAGLRAMAAAADDVGRQFPDEARRIHHGESERRSVRGQASRDEVEALLDEGIAILPVPGDDDLH